MIEQAQLQVKGLGIRDGRALIQATMRSDDFTNAGPISCTLDAYELRKYLDLLIREMEEKQ